MWGEGAEFGHCRFFDAHSLTSHGDAVAASDQMGDTPNSTVPPNAFPPALTMPDDSPALLGGTPIRSAGRPAWPRRTAETDAVLERLRDSGDWGRYHGPHSARLIATLSQSHQREHVQLCASGTVAVELALRGCQVGPGDEVILSAYDFKANFTNVALLGAEPVLVDCREDDAQLDVSAIEVALTEKTKAIIASHLQGGLVDMAALREIADRRGIAVIEDVCQSPGAVVAGRTAGTWGDVATLSFGGSKLVTAGRGGAVLTARPEIAQRIRLYTLRGNEAYPLSEMQAALLLPQWVRLEPDSAARAEVVAELGDLPGLTPFETRVAFHSATGRSNPKHSSDSQQTWVAGSEGFAQGPEQADAPHTAGPSAKPPDPATRCFPSDTGQSWAEPKTTHQPAYYKLGFWYDPSVYDNLPRLRFCQALRAEGIALDPGFAGLHQIHARRRFRAVGDLPNATRACASVVMLHHPLLLGGPAAARDFRAALDKIARHARMLRDAPLPADSTEE